MSLPIRTEERESPWQPIETAPKDGSQFWGLVDDDAIAMFWHDGFGEFVSSFRRMTMAPGWTFDDGQTSHDHSPVIHHPKFWMRIPETPAQAHLPSAPTCKAPQPRVMR